MNEEIEALLKKADERLIFIQIIGYTRYHSTKIHIGSMY